MNKKHLYVFYIYLFNLYHTFLGGYTLLQSRVVVDGVEVEVGILVVGGSEVEIEALVVVLNTAVVECAVVLGIGVVGHGLDCISTLQDALQYATKHHPKPSVTLYTKSPVKMRVKKSLSQKLKEY